ncbi:MAG: M3 family oligoendopeptidase [Phycisphaerales bacterium]|nr:M3 family oligoendopeptidase [Phycisphaerales bacterium]
MTTPQAPEFPRHFVPPDARFDEWAVAEPYYRLLAERPIGTLAELERWLIDASELEAALDEEGVQREILMTCQTDDEERKQRHLYFIEHIAPHAEPWRDKLLRKFVVAAESLALPPRRYEVLERSAMNSIALYREENIPLQVEDQKLITEHQGITGAMTVPYRGREHTLQQLARYQEEPDRKVREETWRLGADRFFTDSAALDKLYEKMVRLRHRMAQNAGFADYRAYMFRRRERFDYTPEDCLRFHEAIEQVCVPAVAQLAAERRAKLGLETLRPWDFACDPEQRPPLRPFETVTELAEKCSGIFHQVDPELGEIFDIMRARDLLDLGSRKGKAPGGYQATLAERRVPFIFMNAVGTDGDVRTLLHEGGHAFHAWAYRQEPFLPYRNSPIEFAEVASMSMELLTIPYWEAFYGAETGRAVQQQFEKIIGFFPYMACIDGFQHYVYTHVEAGIEAWKDHWQQLTRRFMPEVDYAGLEAHDRIGWQKKLHVFQVPFYYVEYGIAQLGALQVWKNSLKDAAQAVAEYRAGLALGASRPLPELFQAAGARFDFSESTLRPLIDAAMAERAK